MSLGVFLFILAILVVVMIHESGHFLTAKLFNFKATQFFVGFGPTLWSFSRGETEYGVKALPLGGFVKILGMNPYEEIAPEDQARSYPNKPAWQRAIVLAAGSATHWVVAFVILVVAAMTIGFPIVTTKVDAVHVGNQSTPASDAGIEPGDRIVAAGGDSVDTWDEVRAVIRRHPDDTVTFTIAKGGVERDVTVRLGRALSNAATGELTDYAGTDEDLRAPRAGEEVVGFLGVAPQTALQTTGLATAVVDSGNRTWDITKQSVLGIGAVFSQVWDGTLWNSLGGEGTRAPGDGPVGIIGAGRIAGQSVESGRYLNLVGLIVGFTIFVGIMNLLPLPPLDGGHLAVVAYEAVTRKRVDLRKLIPIAAAVISFFVLLFLAVLYLDLARPVATPF
jgi:membrane-associated protease RseP (regulator of RpoE activity)